jgi:hypothetical protein
LFYTDDLGWMPVGIADAWVGSFPSAPTVLARFDASGYRMARFSMGGVIPADAQLAAEVGRSQYFVEDAQITFDHELVAEGALAVEIIYDASGQRLFLPTTNPGAGRLWNDGGTVKVGT